MRLSRSHGPATLPASFASFASFVALLLALFVAPLTAHAQQASPLPAASVPDPGVIATGQRITPAGMQTVFDGRVGGVRFARGAAGSGNELWVAGAGSAYRIDWRAGRVLARIRYAGRAGVGGLAIDPVTDRALVATVGRGPSGDDVSRVPGAPLLPASSRTERTRLLLAPASASGDSASVATQSPALGDFMAGAPAVAAQAGADGRRVAVLPLPANDALVVVDASTGAPIRWIPLGVLPIAAVITPDGATAWVTSFGGTKPTATERAVMECCDTRAERVRVDARGIAAPGAVMRVDVATGRVTRTIVVGRHASGLVWDQAHARLYVADGADDAVSVVDTRAARVLETIHIHPFRERTGGLAPTAVALSPDGTRLFVALGGANAVAMYDVAANAKATLAGLIPTGWYPSSLDVSADGKEIAVGTLLGVGSGTGRASGPLVGRYVHAVRGSVHVIDVPDPAQLAAYTAAVAQNDRLTLARGGDNVALAGGAPRPGIAPRPIPERVGEPSPIQHVVFIVRENRTYDQVLGDLGRGDGDSALTMYGRDVTPNAHALSEQFVTLDRFFASGGNSADGHQWLTQANETDYPMWPLYYGRSYPSEDEDALTYSTGGFLWEDAQARGESVTVFGEYAPATKTSSARIHADLLARWRADSARGPAYFRDVLAKMYDTHSNIPSLDRTLVREYPGWTEETPDVVKADVILAHLAEWERAGRMPRLTMVILPNDHTQGTSAGWCAPKACVADNDLALGEVVQGLSHSSFWRRMAIFVVEDDAQDGVDHVDGHRTVALVASPYARRGVIDSTVYTQPSMVKSIELILGLPALSMFDLVATDMRASFIDPGEAPDLTPYTAIVPRQSLADVNPPPSRIRGPHAAERRAAAVASARMNFREPDEAPSDALNRILWHDARGYDVKYPGAHRALFFPMSVDLTDGERRARDP